MSRNVEFGLPAGYHINELTSADVEGRDYWGPDVTFAALHYQVPVYRMAAFLARRHSARTVVDIGCGSADKLMRFLGRSPGRRLVGVDQPSGTALAAQRWPRLELVAGDLESEDLWRRLDGLRADLIICADVIEHLSEPDRFLDRLHAFTGDALVLLSTPDRDRMEDTNPMGPPTNPRHVREWTTDELTWLVGRHGFRVARRHHLLPRGYGWTAAELRRMVRRRLGGQPARDARTCQALELVAEGPTR